MKFKKGIRRDLLNLTRCNYNNRELAGVLGISKNYVSLVLNGKRDFSFDLFIKFCNLTDYNVSDIFPIYCEGDWK